MHLQKDGADRNHQHGEINEELHRLTRRERDTTVEKRGTKRPSSARREGTSGSSAKAAWCTAGAAPRTADRCSRPRGTNDMQPYRHRHYSSAVLAAARAPVPQSRPEEVLSTRQRPPEPVAWGPPAMLPADLPAQSVSAARSA